MSQPFYDGMPYRIGVDDPDFIGPVQERWCTVEVRRVADGVVRTYEYGTWEGEFSGFIWEDGNYACDCNRHLFFERAAGGDPEDIPCSDGRYTVAVFLDSERVFHDGGAA